jgi:16S rRNA (guanine1207-N2)-methyltransferase
VKRQKNGQRCKRSPAVKLGMSHHNAAFASLWYPFQTGALAQSGGMLFLRARAGILPPEIQQDQMDCMQSFKPFADELNRSPFCIIQECKRNYSCVLLLPPPQRDETRALFVQALLACSEDGVVVVSMQNNAGAKSGEADLRQLAGEVKSLSKNKCRVFWANKKNINYSLMQQWQTFDAPRLIESTGLISRPGVFSWDRIDTASKLLSDVLPANLSGNGADLGAGMGYLSHVVLSNNKTVTAMDLYEAEARALACAQLNCEKFAVSVDLKYHWHDVAQGLLAKYDFIISNPPFHQGHDEIQAIGQAFIVSAARALRPNGRFYMVANTHLPYEAILKNHFHQVNVLATKLGYKVFEAIKAAK